jgi:sugar phosphate isomerase/epimerase
VRGEETGIGSSEVPVGGGVNADNIRACMALLHQHGWEGVVSLECSGTDENTRKSVEWMKSVVKGLGKKGKR